MARSSPDVSSIDLQASGSFKPFEMGPGCLMVMVMVMMYRRMNEKLGAAAEGTTSDTVEKLPCIGVDESDGARRRS